MNVLAARARSGINAGTSAIRTDADGWTVRTADGADGALSAQFEHTVLIGPARPISAYRIAIAIGLFGGCSGFCSSSQACR